MVLLLKEDELSKQSVGCRQYVWLDILTIICKSSIKRKCCLVNFMTFVSES